MNDPQRLERIALGNDVVSFQRPKQASAHYYHWHQCVEFLYISEGYGIVVVDKQHYTARPGRFFIFPPFRLHKVQVEAAQNNPTFRTAMHIEHNAVFSALQMFPRHQTQFAALSSTRAPAQIHDLSEHAGHIAYILDRFESQEKQGHRSASDVAFLVMQLLDFLPTQPQSDVHQQQTVAARIMQWVEEHYQHKFSLEELAADIGFSRSYTSRIFRQQTGGGIQEYILTRRIKKSCDLLRYSSLSVTEIAQQVGFTEMTYFITCFKKMLGQSPLQYRKHYAGDSELPER
ncbi:helix-turn-helix domain-containing protein [Kluyvera sp. 142486]|uniref:helix-turn-helix domain-containing protein n=1 Tax=Kluyvera sp. 142486 TaxID=3390050 RepID=UPI00397F433A